MVLTLLILGWQFVKGGVFREYLFLVVFGVFVGEWGGGERFSLVFRRVQFIQVEVSFEKQYMVDIVLFDLFYFGSGQQNILFFKVCDF